MLHTLNKAWTTILMRHDHKSYLFVYSTDDEAQMINGVISKVLKETGVTCDFHVISESDVKKDIIHHQQNGTDFEIYDDILISHDIHDIMLKDYLNRHCKRRCC